jgi:Fe-S-cluster-containing dehydrogenase component
MKVFVIDVARCIGCYACQLACKDEHCANDWMPYTRPQPDTGQFWGKLNEYVRGNTPQVRLSYIFVPCQHCADAPCIRACPVPDGIYRRDDGLVIIDPGKCTGCKTCIDVCPYGSIYFNEYLNLAQKCTGCAHLLDREDGIFETPRCVDVCGTGALKFGEETSFAETIAGAEKLHPEYGLHPRVHYLNLPKKFIAGTVYTPDDEEVAIGATCTLSGENETFTQLTNDWGDFWFDGLKTGTYSLIIEKGNRSKTIRDIRTEKDVGLGDIPLT